MTASIPLGRIAGVPVGAHWSLFVVFALVAQALAGRVLPREHPGHDPSLYWAAGVAAACAFFASLVAHEMGHAMTARRHGVGVEGVTLWLLGGVARLAGDVPAARSELRIALAGPAVSVALALTFVAAGAALGALGAPGLLAGTVAWLGWINGSLALFNMLPAFPLDGGRVLRAWLWRRRSRARATTLAARVGRGIGYVLVGAGGFLTVAGDALDGPWLALIGWFVASAAATEERDIRLRERLAGTRVRDLAMPAVDAPAWVTVDALLQRHDGGDAPHAYVLRALDGALEGVVTLGAMRTVAPEHRAMTRVRDRAVPPERVRVADPDDAVLDALGPSGGSWIVAVRAGRTLGVVTPEDLARRAAAGEPTRTGGLAARLGRR
ncbi:MAG TPA: site-2 protease family protein [Actinomycetota bacterium]|nr:site-2 protease family protein [Actinomycetota bacterium]